MAYERMAEINNDPKPGYRLATNAVTTAETLIVEQENPQFRFVPTFIRTKSGFQSLLTSAFIGTNGVDLFAMNPDLDVDATVNLPGLTEVFWNMDGRIRKQVVALTAKLNPASLNFILIRTRLVANGDEYLSLFRHAPNASFAPPAPTLEKWILKGALMPDQL